jgi:predicted amidohydrolase
MFATGFSMNVASVAEGAARGGERFLTETARRLHCAVIGGVVTAEPGGRGRNEAVAFGPDRAELARYAKLHPFRLAGETDHYAAGDRPVIFDWAGCAVAPLICYDLRFPEAFRLAARRGAELFVVIANWPQVRAAHWTPLLRARAIENQAYVVGVNRCGRDPNHTYTGGSCVVSPAGDVMVELGAAPGVVSAELDIQALRTYRQEFPSLADVRDDLLRDPEDP